MALGTSAVRGFVTVAPRLTWWVGVVSGEWLRNQNHGELDDMKLVDGVTGETLVYKRRGEPDKQLGLHQQKPVRRCKLV